MTPPMDDDEFGPALNSFATYSPEAAFEAGWDRAAGRFEKYKAQTERLQAAIKTALPHLGQAPPLGAFGIAREDCALVHMDYFSLQESAVNELLTALAETQGKTAAKLYHDLGLPPSRCDCRSCIGEEGAAEAREKHRAAYTNVAAWKGDE